MYESADCDYTFNWETSQVCPINFVDKQEYDTIVKDKADVPQPDSEIPKSKSGSKVWVGIVIVVFFVVTLTLLFAYKQRVRYSKKFFLVY